MAEAIPCLQSFLQLLIAWWQFSDGRCSPLLSSSFRHIGILMVKARAHSTQCTAVQREAALRTTVGMSEAGRQGPGGGRTPHQILSHQYTLFQPGRRLCPPHYYLSPQIFRPSDSPGLKYIEAPTIYQNQRNYILLQSSKKIYKWHVHVTCSS